MFTRIEKRTLLVVVFTSTVMLQTGTIWGAGGLITTAIGFYLALGAIVYGASVAIVALARMVIAKYKGARASA